MSQYNKAIAATVAAIVAILAAAGIDIDPTISTAVITLLGALAVYLVPNADPEVEFDAQGRTDRLDP